LRLSKLSIFGFKSFADKVEIPFAPGMTAVVGPNGCGKTNVVDAIKWVLGEQKPTAIRGKTMEDVIFNGSAERKPLSFAEVSLTVEDAEGRLPIDSPEVTITRRVFRDGQGEYLINRQPSRLRDIHDLFMDTGVSNNAYSVIQQEMVDIIISDKAEERRLLFEEAAGIQKYKSRRRETQGKLKNTEQDLLRLGDVIAEVEKNVRSLQRQVSRARRFQKTRDRLSIAEVHLGLMRDRRIDREMKPLREEIRLLRDTRQGTGAGLAQKEAAVAEAHRQALDLEKALSALQLEVDGAREAARQVESELIALRERRAAAEESARRGRNEAEEMDRRRQHALSESERLTDEIAQVRTDLEEHREREEQVGASLAAVEERLADTQRGLDELTDRHARASHYYQDEAQRAEFLQYKVSERRRRLEGLRHQQVEALAEAEQSERESAAIGQRLREIRERRAALVEEREEVDRLRESCSGELRRLGDERAELEGSLKAALAEGDVVRGLLERLEGVGEAARRLRAEGGEGIAGLLAETLQVEPDAVTAVEAALGPALEGLLVADQAALERAVARLGGLERGGRAVMLAAHLATPRTFHPPAWACSEEGVLRPLAEAVRGEGIEARLARRLLGRVLLVTDLDRALALASRAGAVGWTLVTPTGEMVAPAGLVRAGRAAEHGADEGLLARRRRLESLEEEQERLRRALRAAEAALMSETDRLEALKARTAAVRTDLEGLDELLHEQERAQGNAQSRHVGLKERAEDLRVRIADEETELGEDVTELEKLSPLLTQALEESGQLGGQMEAQTRTVRILTGERDRDRQMQQEVRLGRVRAEHRIEGLERERHRLLESADELDQAAVRRRVEAEESEAAAAGLTRVMEEKEGDLEGRREVRIRLEADLSERESSFYAHRNNLAEMEEELRRERRDREEQQERIHSLELRLHDLNGRREHLAERIREEYDIDLAAVEESELLAEGEEPPEYEALDEEVRTLKERLDKLGPVNLLALEEYETEKERFDFLTVQRDDLVAARDDLQQTIRKINKTARDRFTATFEAIRANFRRTYSQFFEGGEADIYLGDEADPLESRIEIVARPKGKILKNMAALSGGERALTAVALLFAIYLVKPSPFCILDEVDAPLDEANIGRFLRVLKQFGETTQFILITHSKRTMESSDTFLGITMEEPGISKVVGVRFGEEEEAAA
jgi:chromosome segregation protein